MRVPRLNRVIEGEGGVVVVGRVITTIDCLPLHHHGWGVTMMR